MPNPNNTTSPSANLDAGTNPAFDTLRAAVVAGTKTLPATNPKIPRTDGALRDLWQRHQTKQNRYRLLYWYLQ